MQNKNNSLADQFMASLSHNDVVGALNKAVNEGLPLDQDWRNERTLILFSDASRCVVGTHEVFAESFDDK